MLADLLTPALADWLGTPPPLGRYLDADELDRVVDGWSGRGARVTVLGFSGQGRPIRAASFGDGPRSMLAWGFPHPDEPLGAMALVWLGDGLAAGRLPDLAGWTVHLVLCADPDQVALNAGWLHGERSAQSFASGCWRPQHLGLEVDYGFQVDWGPFVPFAWGDDDLLRCRSAADCAARCGPGGCRRRRLPFGPLSESAALAAAIDLFCPDVAATMHGVSAGGSYTFLLEGEDRRVMDDLLALPQACGTGRHLGEPIDGGRRWRTRTPDLIKEKKLASRLAGLQRSPGYDPDVAYHATFSVAEYLEAQGRGAQLITPEVAQFRHVAFGDDRPSGLTETVRVSVEDRPSGRWEMTRIQVDGQWVVAHQDRADGRVLRGPAQRQVPATRGMLGVRALMRRRRMLAAADDVWSSLLGQPWLVWHPALDERWATLVPGAFVHDRSMLIFRTRADYRRPATVAQAASFGWRWPLHSAALLGGLQGLIDRQDPARPEVAAAAARVGELRDRELAELPPELMWESDPGPAMRCALARVLRVMQARA